MTTGTDLTKAWRLKENLSIAFMGDTKGGPFDIPHAVALEMLDAPNPHGRSNRDVIRPWMNGLDITRHPRGMWIIDFGVDMPESEAALYVAPFEFLRVRVEPQLSIRREIYTRRWWLHTRPRPEMREALRGLSRFIATPRVAKHRLFVWLRPEALPDSQLIVFARDDDYTFGVLQSRVHEVWARSMGTQLREAESGFRYTPTTTFETFPFPIASDDQRRAIATAAEQLNTLREAALNPPGESGGARRPTLTQLYNQRPTWLVQAHERLDAAVLNAYGWPRELDDNSIRERLLVLNLERKGLERAYGSA